MNKRNGKQNRTIKRTRPSKNRNLKNEEKMLELALIKTYPKQVVWEVWLPVLPSKLTTVVATGLIASSYQVSVAAIASFAARFGSTFVEYRIIRAKLGLRLFSSTNPGVLQTWFDEQSAAAPVVAEAYERYISSYSAASVDDSHLDKWIAGDPLDLQYRSTAVVYTPVTYKVFTNNAAFGSSIVATDYAELQGYLQFQFRGLLGV